jgi:hypothetical protein
MATFPCVSFCLSQTKRRSKKKREREIEEEEKERERRKHEENKEKMVKTNVTSSRKLPVFLFHALFRV